ncbi:hypothetical protein SAMN04488074_12283 [Lentzea albidocapillata subsp. violacea]|uniref:Uncharacterized protein n=1 Tax=Lentzea albidocapillata subsp. violacea TaxID=128104 RepID=A0A1G9TQ11_9PSEU|nr:hypothetical protein [Lentzea albidocapillata]SDM49524.1 hypothetical protein SAMN04488074_12283 [Lentzea albidocapillata subsp. violacea]
MQIEPSRWPGRVVPSTGSDVDVAVESLCVRASWADADRRWVRRLLEPWFRAGWSVDALLVAIDKKPDGTSQGRPRSRAQVAHEFLRARLRTWTADGAGIAKPPLAGISLGEWYRVNRRNAALNAPRRGVGLSSQGRQAQAETRALAHRRDPVERSREKGRRRQEVLDSLLVPGQEVPSFADSWRLVAELIPVQRVCSSCGHVRNEVPRPAHRVA